MALFFTGLGLFLLGAIINAVGWRLDARTVKAAGEGFNEWLLTVVKKWFDMLTGPNHTTGERMAAFGAILSAIGIVLAVAGIAVWAS